MFEAVADTAAKLAFLRSPASYGGSVKSVQCIETHMSWLFLTEDWVYKLKKPVVFAFLDFSTLAARAFYCREEVRVNARLAPSVYHGVLALQKHRDAFALVPETQISAKDRTVDWLVQMRRLPADRALHQSIASGKVRVADMDGVMALLAGFYRTAPAIALTGPDYRARLQGELTQNREILLRPQFQLPDAARALQRFSVVLTQGASLLQARTDQHRLRDGHGDLRPDHVFLTSPPVVIDCLEFNPQLRHVDPFDEIAYLGLECEMAGAAWIGPYLWGGMAKALEQTPPVALHHLYTAHRALQRARLAMAHLLDPQPTTPQRWTPLADRYIAMACAAIGAFNAAMPGDLPQ